MNVTEAIKQGSTVEIIRGLIPQLPINKLWLDYEALNVAIEYGRKDVALLLLENNCRVNKTVEPCSMAEPWSSTPLHKAVMRGDAELVHNLLEKNASITAVNSQGNSPLHLAFLLKFDRIIDLIVVFIKKTGTYINLKNQYGLSHFHIACTLENVPFLKSYIANEKPSIKDSISKESPFYPGFTVMQFAIEFNCPKVLKFLLKHKGICPRNQVLKSIKQAKKLVDDTSVMIQLLSSYAQVDNLENQTLISQFHVACLQNNVSLIKNYLQCGVDVNSSMSKESTLFPLYTSLHYAVEANCIESVKFLLDHGADPIQPDINNMTPLHLALYKNNDTIINLVYGSAKSKLWNFDISDCNGLNYFHIAISRNDLEVVEYLLNKGQNVKLRVSFNSRGYSGYSPLHFAVRYGHLEVAKLLIQYGAHINASDMGKHGTALHMAFSAAHGEFITLLIENGAKVDCLRPCDDKTVLHLLIEKHINLRIRDVPLVNDYIRNLVLLRGINVNAKDKAGYTALHYACASISIGGPCAVVLLQCGADINLSNENGDTPFQLSFYNFWPDCAEDYVFLYHHVKGLITLGFNVHPHNYDCCEKLLRMKHEFRNWVDYLTIPQLNKIQRKRDEEMRVMQNTEIWWNVSMYGFVMMNPMELDAIGINDNLKILIESRLLSQHFPEFGYLVNLQCRRWYLQRMP